MFAIIVLCVFILGSGLAKGYMNAPPAFFDYDKPQRCVKQIIGFVVLGFIIGLFSTHVLPGALLFAYLYGAIPGMFYTNAHGQPGNLIAAIGRYVWTLFVWPVRLYQLWTHRRYFY